MGGKRPGSIFSLLLRKSDEGGDGDFYGYRKAVGEGGPIIRPLSPIAGRWAGDRILAKAGQWGDLGAAHLAVLVDDRRSRAEANVRLLAAQYAFFRERPTFRRICFQGNDSTPKISALSRLD